MPCLLPAPRPAKRQRTLRRLVAAGPGWEDPVKRCKNMTDFGPFVAPFVGVSPRPRPCLSRPPYPVRCLYGLEIGAQPVGVLDRSVFLLHAVEAPEHPSLESPSRS